MIQILKKKHMHSEGEEHLTGAWTHEEVPCY
jgi:hypothetical protein